MEGRIHVGTKTYEYIQNIDLEIFRDEVTKVDQYKWNNNIKLDLRVIRCQDIKYTENV